MRFVGWAVPTFPKNRESHRGEGGHGPPYWIVLLLFLCSVASGGSNAWPVPDAVLKFTVEADVNQPQVPSIDISGQKTAAMDWSGGYYRIDGKTYKNAVPMTCPGKAVYGCKEEYRRFVALIGVRDDAGDAASIVFEVLAGDRKIYTSPPLTKYSTPIGIDVRIPPKTKEIRLVTSGTSSEGHHWAGWANAGFQTRDDASRVAYVTLPVPGFDPSKYEVVVFTTNGARVPATRLSALEPGKVDQLFFNGQGWSTYYAYWVPKEKYEPEPKEWLPAAGLVLETRRVDKSRQSACEDLSGLVKVWNEASQVMGRSFVVGVHHGFPVHPRLSEAQNEAAKNSLALYRYTGFFEASRAGDYIFATVSTWGSHLLVDDRLVASWPGTHDPWAGIRGEKQGKIALQPGIHKLDYFNYSPWGTMLTLAAWQPPGTKQLGVMTASDFPSLRGYVVTAVESNPAAERKICFDWNVVDDWRRDQDRVALIRMRFRAIPDRSAEDGGQKTEDREQKTAPSSVLRPPSSDFRWTFDDGVVKTGRTVERVFFTSGSHTVKVQMLKGDQVLAETTQTVYAGAVADKMWAEPRDPKAFQRQMAQIDWRKAPIQDVVRLYTIGVELPEPVWKKAAVPVFLDRIGELMAQPQYQPLCLELGQYLTSAPVQQYDRALSLYTSLLEKTKEGTPIRQQTMVLAGEVSLRCLGKPDAALRLLNQARWEKAPDKTWTIRLGQVRAEALLAVGDTKELDAQMQQLRELGTKQDPRRQALRHAGLLEQAAVLARVKDDPVQWDYAMDNLQTILGEEPDQVLSPALNRVRLDVHLARGEYKIARYLAECLAKLDQTVYDRAQVLLRQVKALCALGDTDSAKKVLDELTRIYPNSDPAAQAKALVVEAVRKPRPQ